MTDIVDLLRDDTYCGTDNHCGARCEDAAREIELLRYIVRELIGEAMGPWPEGHSLASIVKKAFDRPNPEGDR